MERVAVVAGSFYPGEPMELGSTVDGYLEKGANGAKKRKATVIIAPHAGYIYSGSVAGSVYSRVRVPDTVLLIGPNHTGIGTRVSLMASGQWRTPLGLVEVDSGLASALAASTPLISVDVSAHVNEHSLEVQLPFLQRKNSSVKIAPITVMAATKEECKELGEAIGQTVAASTDEILIVVSSDMNHYEADDITREKDRRAIEAVLALDSETLLEVTKREHITMCGALPTAIAIEAALRLGAGKAQLVDYATSGEVSGDYNAVVGYAGIIIE